jgi:hypothetical protein
MYKYKVGPDTIDLKEADVGGPLYAVLMEGYRLAQPLM